MNSPTKLVIALLLLVLLAFAGVLAWAVTRDDESGPTAWLTQVGESLLTTHPVGTGEVLSNCFSEGIFTVPAGVTCQATLRAADDVIRTLKLRLVTGAKAQIQLEPRGEGGISVRFPLRSGATSPELQVLQDGAQLTLRCEALECPDCSGAITASPEDAYTEPADPA